MWWRREAVCGLPFYIGLCFVLHMPKARRGDHYDVWG